MISSLTNVLFIIAFARSASASDFGAFSVGMATVVFGAGISRVVLGTLISVRGSRLNNFGHDENRHLLGLAFVGAALVLPITLGVGLYTHSLQRLGLSYFVLAAAGSVVLVQDLLRFASISFRRPATAVVGDSLWLLFVLVPIALQMQGDVQPSSFVICMSWAAGAMFSTVAMTRSLAAVPKWSGLPEWFAHHGLSLKRLFGDAVLGMSVALAVAIASARFLSFQDTAGLRGASTLVGPISVIFSAISLVVVPELSASQDPHFRRARRWLTSILAGAVIVWGGVLYALPSSVGEGILGESWPLARQILPVTVVEFVFWALIVFPVSAMKVREQYRGILISRGIYVASAVVAVSVGLFTTHSMQGVALGLAVAAFCHAVSAWFLMLRGESGHNRTYV